MHMCMYIGISLCVFEDARKRVLEPLGNVSCLIWVLGTELCPPKEQYILILFEPSLSPSLC